jgi:hypothetical protein
MKTAARQLLPVLLCTGLAWLFIRIGMAVFFPA